VEQKSHACRGDCTIFDDAKYIISCLRFGTEGVCFGTRSSRLCTCHENICGTHRIHPVHSSPFSILVCTFSRLLTVVHAASSAQDIFFKSGRLFSLRAFFAWNNTTPHKYWVTRTCLSFRISRLFWSNGSTSNFRSIFRVPRYTPCVAQ
jgi:hypothetical protein